MKEKELQQEIVDIAARLGYWHYHTHDSRHSDYGFPDLCLVSRARRRVIWIECKGEKGETTLIQQDWLDNLAICGEEVYIVFPQHLEEITRILMLAEKPTVNKRKLCDCAVVFAEEK